MTKSPAQKRKNARREKKRYYDRLAKGFCGRCGKVKVEPGIMVCATCRTKDAARRVRDGREPHNEQRRRRRRTRARTGACSACGEPNGSEFLTCTTCRAKSQAYYAKVIRPLRQRAKARPFQLCSGCRNTRPTPGMKTCEACREKAKTYYHDRGKALRQNKKKEG